MTDIAQDFEATRKSIALMRDAAQISSETALRAVDEISHLQWTGSARRTFEQVAAGWYSAMIREINSLTSFLDTSERVVNEQQQAEEARASGVSQLSGD